MKRCGFRLSSAPARSMLGGGDKRLDNTGRHKGVSGSYESLCLQSRSRVSEHHQDGLRHGTFLLQWIGLQRVTFIGKWKVFFMQALPGVFCIVFRRVVWAGNVCTPLHGVLDWSFSCSKCLLCKTKDCFPNDVLMNMQLHHWSIPVFVHYDTEWC